MTNYIVRLFLDLGQVRLPTVDAMLINSYEFKFLFTSCAFPIRSIGSETKSNWLI